MKRFIHEVTEADYKRAAKNGISRAQAYGRMYYSGWDVDRAVTEPIEKRSARDPWVSVARSNDISQQLYRYRVKKKGMSPEEAATTPVMSIYAALEKAREKRPRAAIYTREQMETAKRNRIKENTFIFRVKNGMPPEEACVKPVRTYMKRG